MNSFNASPKQLNYVTLSFTVLLTTKRGIPCVGITFWWLWKIMDFVLSTLEESLLTASQSQIFYTFDNTDNNKQWLHTISVLNYKTYTFYPCHKENCHECIYPMFNLFQYLCFNIFKNIDDHVITCAPVSLLDIADMYKQTAEWIINTFPMFYMCLLDQMIDGVLVLSLNSITFSLE